MARVLISMPEDFLNKIDGVAGLMYLGVLILEKIILKSKRFN